MINLVNTGGRQAGPKRLSDLVSEGSGGIIYNTDAKSKGGYGLQPLCPKPSPETTTKSLQRLQA